MNLRLLLVSVVGTFFSALIFAQTTSVDPALEARVKALSLELRCLVCQNQTVADSDAPVARDMRDQVRTQLAAGKSESEVKRYMTDRFGDFVLYKPAFQTNTLLLWLGPFLVLALGLFVVVRVVRKKQSVVHVRTGLSDAERERARRLLATHANAANEK